MQSLVLITFSIFFSSVIWAQSSNFEPVTGDSFEAFGRQWHVKRKAERHGPGPNIFGKNPENVAKSRNGSVKLEILRSPTGWSCAEIISKEPVAYGDY